MTLFGESSNVITVSTVLISNLRWKPLKREIRGHGGGGANSGINSRMEIFWDWSYTVIVLSNYDAPAAEDLAHKICEFLALQQ